MIYHDHPKLATRNNNEYQFSLWICDLSSRRERLQQLPSWIIMSYCRTGVCLHHHIQLTLGRFNEARALDCQPWRCFSWALLLWVGEQTVADMHFQTSPVNWWPRNGHLLTLIAHCYLSGSHKWTAATIQLSRSNQTWTFQQTCSTLSTCSSTLKHWKQLSRLD